MKSIEYINDPKTLESLFPELLREARLKGFTVGVQDVDGLFSWVLIYRKASGFMCLWYQFTDNVRICEKMAEIANKDSGVSYRRIMQNFARWISRTQFPAMWELQKTGANVDWRFFDERLGYETNKPELDAIPPQNLEIFRICESRILALYSDAMKTFPHFPDLHRDLLLRLFAVRNKLRFPIPDNDKLVVEGIVWDSLYLIKNPEGKARDNYEILKETI